MRSSIVPMVVSAVPRSLPDNRIFRAAVPSEVVPMERPAADWEAGRLTLLASNNLALPRPQDELYGGAGTNTTSRRRIPGGGLVVVGGLGEIGGRGG